MFSILTLLVSISFCQLYGISPSLVSLLSVDPQTAQTKQIGPTYYELDAMQLAAMDSDNGILYGISFNSSDSKCYLYGIDLETGDLTSHMQLPFEEEILVGAGQSITFDTTTGDVFVSGYIGKLHHIFRVNLSKKTLTEIASIGDVDILGGAFEFNPSTQILYMQYGLETSEEIDIFGWDVQSGKLVTQVENTHNLETMTFDPKTKKIYGIGLEIYPNSTFKRTLLSLDSKHQIEIIAEIEGYFIIFGSIGTINVAEREYYTFLQEADTQPDDSFDLLVIDLDTGKIKSNAKCSSNEDDEIPSCPWSLEYKN